MNLNEFEKQMNRLTGTFGKAAYSEERVKLIWAAVRYSEPGWWASAVDELIGSSRTPPLMPEIRDAMTKERERSWAAEKRTNTRDAKEFMSFLASEDIALICQGIRQRISGGMADDAFESFLKSLNGIASGR